MTIVQYLETTGYKLTRVNYSELSGACPFCGGKDRFRLWPQEGDKGGYWLCRGCSDGRRSDGI
ncbi:MAG: hypothetical protein HUJ63_06905, partial [Enterococcus sp.]|nr:hypothetical protein [Enterococcus sp.]